MHNFNALGMGDYKLGGIWVKPEPLYTLHMFVASARHTSVSRSERG